MNLISSKINEMGNRYGKLIVISDCGIVKHGERSKWLCKCDCGNEKIVTGKPLRNGHVKSCGCLHKEQSIKNLPLPQKKENNPFWKGGITSKQLLIRNSDKYKTWRKAVFERDGYICQNEDCERSCHELNAHHYYISFKECLDDEEILYNIDNGITLCEKCHRKVHTSNSSDNDIRFVIVKAVVS